MYRPKKHVRLDPLPHAPKVVDVKGLAEESKKAKGCTVELPWKNKLTGVHYSLTVRLEVAGGDPMWTLYEGEGGKSRVVWSSPFEDVDLLYDVLMLSIPEEVETDFAPAKGSAEKARAQGTAHPPGFYDSGLLTGNEKVEMPSTSISFFQSGIEKDDDYLLKEEPAPKSKPKTRQNAEDQTPPAQPDVSQPGQASEHYPGQSGAYPTQSGAYPTQSGAHPTQSGAYPTQSGAYPTQSGAYPTQSGAYPYQVPPQGYPQGYYPPGYPQQYPPGYPPYGYPPGYPPAAAGTVAIQPGQPAPPQGITDTGAHAQPQVESGKPRPNLRLGQFLVEAGLVPETTIDAALQLQELVRSGSLSTAQAAEAVRRAHIRGGAVDPRLISAPVRAGDLKALAPPLGQILVEAAIVRGPVIRQALKLQESIRDATMTKEEALDALCLEVFGVGRKSQEVTGESSESTRALELLRKAQLVGDLDHETASKVRDKHGGQLVAILVKAGKLDQHTADGAFKCNELIDRNKLEEGKAIIALHYCQRSRIDLDSALKELGWES